MSNEAKSQTEINNFNQKPCLRAIVFRGFFGYCPGCGTGKLFASYLRQVESCDYCHLQLSEIYADDGPIWLTLLLVCHIIAPFLIYGIPYLTCADYWIMLIIIMPSVLMTLVLLPRIKGVFIGVIWHLGAN